MYHEALSSLDVKVVTTYRRIILSHFVEYRLLAANTEDVLGGTEAQLQPLFTQILLLE